MTRPITRKDEYTVPEVADILQVNAETVRRLIRSGGTPRAPLVARNLGMGTGGGYRVSHRDLERFVKALYPYLSLDLDDHTRPMGRVPSNKAQA